MPVAAKHIQKCREELEKTHGRKISDEEMQKVVEFLELLANICYDCFIKEQEKKMVEKTISQDLI